MHLFHWRLVFRLFHVASSTIFRNFRSDAALLALRTASEAKTTNLILYNYPSFSGEYAALFAHLYHSRLNLPCLILPFSSVVPFRWRQPDIKAFKIGLSQWRSKFNWTANPCMYQQLTEMSSTDLIKRGNTYLSCRQDDASKLLHKVFRVQLGRGFYGECLGFRADGNSELSGEIGYELSKRSAAAGLRPIGAVVYMQRNNLKMCLRTTHRSTDTSEIAKAYGGGGSPSSSSFIIRMDEYNHWLSANHGVHY